MIKVIVDDFVLDLSRNGVTTVDKNNIFRDTITKSYTYPFSLIVTKEIARAFGFILENNIYNYPTKIDVIVLVDNKYHNGYLKVFKIVNRTASVSLFYGIETLPVYDKKLKTLPFEIVDEHDVKLFAKTQNTKQWPEATHNFVTIKDPSFEGEESYDKYLGYVNNTLDGNFIANEFETIEEETTVANKNVMIPMPYLMEVLKVGYAQENKVIKGGFVNDVFNHKIVIVPETILERYFTALYNDSNFTTPTSNYVSGDVVYSQYDKTYPAAIEGTFKLYFKINLPATVYSYFKLTIMHNNKVVYAGAFKDTDVNIEEEFLINVDPGDSTGIVSVSLRLLEQQDSISDYNFFKYEHQAEKLNLFANKYQLAIFMPDLTFRDFVNAVENLFNLDVDVQDNVVYLDYLADTLPNVLFNNFSKYDNQSPSREVNNDKVFGLKFADESSIYVNKNGVLPVSDPENLEDLVTIDIPVNPLKVEVSDGIKTALNVSDSSALKLCLYNGLVNDKPLAAESVNGRSLIISDFFKKWETWLKFRTSSEVIEDVFYAHVDEILDVKKGIIKYNKKHLLKEIKKTSKNKKYNKVTFVFESF